MKLGRKIKIILPQSQIKSPTLNFDKKPNFNLIKGQYNLFFIVTYGTLIMSQKGNGTVDLRRPKKAETDGEK